MFQRILVAIDGSATAAQGLKTACQLASDQHAVLTIVHVLDDFTVAANFDGGYLSDEFFNRMIESMRQAGIKLVDNAGKQAREGGVEAKTKFVETRSQNIAQAIIALALEDHSDVIVLGTHGRRGLRRLLLGSDAEQILRESPVPVLLVRNQEHDGP